MQGTHMKNASFLQPAPFSSVSVCQITGAFRHLKDRGFPATSTTRVVKGTRVEKMPPWFLLTQETPEDAELSRKFSSWLRHSPFVDLLASATLHHLNRRSWCDDNESSFLLEHASAMYTLFEDRIPPLLDTSLLRDQRMGLQCKDMEEMFVKLAVAFTEQSWSALTPSLTPSLFQKFSYPHRPFNHNMAEGALTFAKVSNHYRVSPVRMRTSPTTILKGDEHISRLNVPEAMETSSLPLKAAYQTSACPMERAVKTIISRSHPTLFSFNPIQLVSLSSAAATLETMDRSYISETLRELRRHIASISPKVGGVK
eukprot:GHVN01053476.1.p1 GENE.GHVN01053476.1~~GHVN01053476.1.p1  ORF type:complete len:313 (-),score=22.35 GHVN01053476.1:907-1845(-)